MKSFYRSVGEGRPLVLLHGFPFSSEIFWPWLEAPLSGVRLICPDLRGFGQSEMRPGPSTMEVLGADVFELLDTLGIQQALVGGVSMGGYVALAMTRLDPSRVSGLVLLDTHMSADDAAAKIKREETARDVEAHGVGVGGLTDGMLPKLLSPQAPAEVRDRVEEIMRAQAPAAVAAAARGMALREDSRDIVARFSGPVFIASGEHDPFAPPEKAKAMAELASRSSLQMVPDAQHLAHLEQPKVVTEALQKWLNEIG